MSPSAKGTLQVSESSNQLNPNIKTVTSTIESGTGQKEFPEQPTPQIPEQKGLLEKIRGFVETKRGKVTVGIAGVALAGGITGGVWAANSGKAPEKTSHSTSAPNHTSAPSSEATPSATPTTTPETTGTADYNYNLTQADIAPLLAGDVYTLNTGTVESKAKIAEFYAQDLPKFAEDWQSVSKNPADVLPSELSENNTATEAIAFVGMAHRQAMTLHKADLTFDKDASDKLLAASFINGTLSPNYISLSNFGAQLNDGSVAPSARSLAAENYMQLPTINKASDKYVDAAGRTCYDVNITQTFNGGAAPVTSDITTCLVKNENGSIWMQR